MLTIEQLDQLQIFGLTPRVKKERQLREIKAQVTNGKWELYPAIDPEQWIYYENMGYDLLDTWDSLENLLIPNRLHY
jgi:hypothetical protein